MAGSRADHFLSAGEHQAAQPYVIVDDQVRVVACNRRARKEGFSPGTPVTRYFTRTVAADFLLRERKERQFDTLLGTVKPVRIHLVPLEDSVHTGLWIDDLTEIRLLQYQITRLKKPERKFLHTLKNAIATTLGYAELVNLMLEESTVITSTRLASVRRYQQEVNRGLQKCESLISEEKGGTNRTPAPAGGKNRVLVQHHLPERAHLLTELLRTRKFRVTCFQDTQTTLDYVSLNPDSIDIAVVDGRGDVVRRLLDANPETQILVCGQRTPVESERLCVINDQPLDINELLEKILELR